MSLVVLAYADYPALVFVSFHCKAAFLRQYMIFLYNFHSTPVLFTMAELALGIVGVISSIQACMEYVHFSHSLVTTQD